MRNKKVKAIRKWATKQNEGVKPEKSDMRKLKRINQHSTIKTLHF